MRPLRRRAVGLTVAVALVCGAAAAAWNHHASKEEDRHVAELAPLMARYLWDLDQEQAVQHAKALLDASDYAEIRITHADGAHFLDVTQEPQGELSRLLQAVGLQPLVEHEQPLRWDLAGPAPPQRIGTLVVTRPDHAALVYLQAGLLVLIASLVLTSRFERQQREVAARNLQLVQEKANRLEAEARLADRELQLQERRNLETLGRLSAGVAHDLNNILTVMIGAAEVVELLAENDKARSQADTILSAADKATALTRQLLAFGRRQVMEPKPVLVNEVIRAFEPILQRAVGDRVTLRQDLAPDLGVVLADPAQLEQVILNLVVNARDAMPDGGTVELITRDVDGPTSLDGGEQIPPGPWVALAVRDTGQGMDAETVASVFEPFFTTKAAGKGTGLGLATVYGIVRQSGGEIEVSSGLGKGSCFTVLLPRTEGQAPVAPGRRSYSLDDSIDPRGQAVLLVEDREEVREVMAGALRRHGLRVEEACDGLMALTMVREGGCAFDLLVTDLTMPGLGGWDLAERLRASRPELKVLFVSGDPSAELTDDFRSSDTTAMLHKPFGARTLVDAVHDLLVARPHH